MKKVSRSGRGVSRSDKEWNLTKLKDQIQEIRAESASNEVEDSQRSSKIDLASGGERSNEKTGVQLKVG